MDSEDVPKESFEDFKKSFSYGSRNDLNFKFLAHLSDREASRFFRELLWNIGDSYDDGDFDRIVEHVFNWQVKAYSGPGRYAYDEGPFVKPAKAVAESKLALLTSSGHFVAGHDPEPFGVKDMTQEEAVRRIGEFLKEAPALSTIPADTPVEKLQVRHGGYDIRGALADHNVAFPLQRLRELEQEGAIGEIAPDAYSFIGACAQTRLLKETGPEWVSMLKEKNLDAVFLVPV